MIFLSKEDEKIYYENQKRNNKNANIAGWIRFFVFLAIVSSLIVFLYIKFL
jgi:hypothetical protein